MCYYTLISLIPPSKYFSCPSIFWGTWTCLEVVPRSALFLWTPPSTVQGTAAWQHSTMMHLIHKAGEEFRDKAYIWNYRQKETESMCRLLRAAEEQTLVTQREGAKGTDSRGPMWGALSSCPLCTGQKESTGEHSEIRNFLVLLIFQYVSSFENMDWQRREGYQEKASWYLPLGWIISLPFYRYQRGEPCWCMALESSDTELDREERDSPAKSTTQRSADNPTSTVVFVACLLRRVLHGL